MSFQPGTRLGPYEVLASLGSGPEERYKASDTRANRVVMLRILPSDVSGHPGLKERLERDSQIISALKHPNISAPLDVGHEDPATDFVVTEYVVGETLADRLTRGRLDLQDALAIARAVADSLDKAHRQSVIHGGLNPRGIVLTKQGPKIVDFGLSQLPSGVAAAAGVSMLTTRTSVSTLAAIPPFAAGYLAPEQFAGSHPDARSDIFALGAILYEMIAGRPPFQEKTLALQIAAAQTVEPDPVSKAQPMVPPALDHLVKRCLSKDPRQRLQTAWDLMIQLQWIAEGGSKVGLPAPVAARRKVNERIVWAALAAAVALSTSLAVLAWSSSPDAPEPEVARFTVRGLPEAAAIPISISPDGRWIVGSPGSGSGPVGVQGVFLGSVTPQRLLEGAIVTQPFWSPDSRSIAFFEAGVLKRADIGGGPAQSICETPGVIGGGTWSRDGVILFASDGVIHRVLAAGGQPTAITTLDESLEEREHSGPSFLPDGRHFLYHATSKDSGIYVGSTDSGDRTRLFAADARAVYVEPGYILFNRGSAVFAQRFDAASLTLVDEPLRVVDGVSMLTTGPNVSATANTRANFAVSQTGVLVFKTGGTPANDPGSDEQRSLNWFDRAGVLTEQVGPLGTYAGVDVAEGGRLAAHVHAGTGGDIWSFDQGRMQRLTFDASQDNASPAWSPDGTKVAFGSRRNNGWGIYVKLANGTGSEDLLAESDLAKMPMSWTPDGTTVLYWQNGDIWAVSVEDRKQFPIVQDAAAQNFPQLSPDGKWLAYQSNEGGGPEIYVRPFPEGPGKWQISTNGGQWPRWRGDGAELFYLQTPNMMAVDIRVSGPSLQPGVPRSLFLLGGNPSIGLNHPSYHRYGVSRDGQRFLISQPGASTSVAGGLADTVAAAADQGVTGAAGFGVNVIVNWPQMVSRR